MGSTHASVHLPTAGSCFRVVPPFWGRRRMKTQNAVRDRFVLEFHSLCSLRWLWFLGITGCNINARRFGSSTSILISSSVNLTCSLLSVFEFAGFESETVTEDSWGSGGATSAVSVSVWAALASIRRRDIS